MAHIDPSKKEVVAKVVYYGPALAGKTTSILSLNQILPADQRGPLYPVASDKSRSLLLELKPPGLELVHGLPLRCQLHVADGPVLVQLARRALLRDADAVVFVADSQAAAMDQNVASLESLERILLAGWPATPLVIQYNKRDLPTALPIDVLGQELNRRGVPAFQTIAQQGLGVAETLRVVIRRLFKVLAQTDMNTLLSGEPQRRPTARLAALDPAVVAAAAASGDGTRPLRRPTEQSLAQEDIYSLPENRHLTIPAMSREAFLAASRLAAGPMPTAKRLEDTADRYATLPAAPRERFGREPGSRHDTLRAGPGLPRPEAEPVKDEEETRPLRLSTAASLARESMDSESPAASRTAKEDEGALPGPVPPRRVAEPAEPRPRSQAAPPRRRKR